MQAFCVLFTQFNKKSLIYLINTLVLRLFYAYGASNRWLPEVGSKENYGRSSGNEF